MLSVKLRKEILDSKTEGELVKQIDIALAWHDYKFPEPNMPPSIGGLEGNPEWFFDHTYPTAVLKDIIYGIKEKLEGKAVGIWTLQGGMGSGKSHILLTIYHLFRNPKKAEEWLKHWNIYFRIPENAILIPIPLSAISVENLWDPVFKALGHQIEVREDDWPRGNKLKNAIENRTTIILIDEMDNWFDAKNENERA
ncbi:MAG: hypothetical protein ACE5KE_01370 [Methanosarcinales archaeon]